MDGWMDGRTVGWIDEWFHGWMKGWFDRWINSWMIESRLSIKVYIIDC